MITVTIAVNTRTIFHRSATNTDKTEGDLTGYAVDTGEILWHDPDKGAVALAIQMLRTIREQKTAARRSDEMDFYFKQLTEDNPE